METTRTLLDKLNKYSEMLLSFDSSMEVLAENVGLCKAMDDVRGSKYWQEQLRTRAEAKKRVENRFKELVRELNKIVGA